MESGLFIRSAILLRMRLSIADASGPSPPVASTAKGVKFLTSLYLECLRLSARQAAWRGSAGAIKSCFAYGDTMVTSTGIFSSSENFSKTSPGLVLPAARCLASEAGLSIASFAVQ